MSKNNRTGTYDEGQEVKKIIEAMPTPMLLAFMRIEDESDTHKTVVISWKKAKQNQGDTK